MIPFMPMPLFTYGQQMDTVAIMMASTSFHCSIYSNTLTLSYLHKPGVGGQ
jgi:hypothetical protein